MTEGSHEEAIEDMWDEYAPVRDEVVELLSDWQQDLVRGNPAEVREEVRSLSDRQQQVFQLLVLIFRDVDQFWADTEATLEDDKVSHLKDIQASYGSQLGEMFSTVYAESTYGHLNTITETTTNIEMKNGGSDPVIKFEALSGRVPVFELHETPAHFLDLAETYVSSVSATLDLADQFGSDDIENIKRQMSRLEKKTSEVAESINSIETEQESTDELPLETEETTENNDK